MQLELNLYPKDDNLIRLMLQPPKTGKDDPYFQAAERATKKRDRYYSAQRRQENQP